ncbi:MAG: ComF family protein [Amphritea sp.]
MLNLTVNSWLIFNQKKLCILCDQRSHNELPICRDCQADLPWLRTKCQHCSLPLLKPTKDTLLCPNCLKRPPPFYRITAAFHYRFPVNQLIMRGKFNRQPAYLALLARLMIEKLDLSTPPDVLIPVPIHYARLRQREYNQAFLIAKIIAQQLCIKLDCKLIKKSRNTEQQADLDAKARRRNLRNSFSCLKKPPRHVAIIDDVVTTGATATEITRVLRKAGCKRVEIWAIARTGKQD